MGQFVLPKLYESNNLYYFSTLRRSDYVDTTTKSTRRWSANCAGSLPNHSHMSKSYPCNGPERQNKTRRALRSGGLACKAWLPNGKGRYRPNKEQCRNQNHSTVAYLDNFAMHKYMTLPSKVKKTCLSLFPKKLCWIAWSGFCNKLTTASRKRSQETNSRLRTYE